MKILAALSRFPWPLEKGDKLRAFHQLKDLARNNEVHLVCLNDEPVSEEHRRHLDFCTSIQVIPQSPWTSRFNLLGTFFNRLPFQVNYFRSGKMKRVLDETIRSQSIDVVMVQLIRLGMNLPLDAPTGWFLDYMDTFSIGMEQRSQEASWPVRPFVKMEARRLKRYEGVVAAKFDELGIISTRDAEGLPESLQEYVHIIPNGVGEDFFASPEQEVEKAYDLVFFGNMGYHPNVQSAHFLVEEVLPELERLGRKVRLCIAGARPAKSVQNLSNKHIEVTGFVDDIRDYIWRSRLAVAPVIGGQGLQNKLLESMAMGLPTLTTPLSFQAIKAEAGKEIVVCEDAKAFAREIDRLLAQPEMAREIGAAGRAFVETHYRWSAMNQKLEEVLRKASRS